MRIIFILLLITNLFGVDIDLNLSAPQEENITTSVVISQNENNMTIAVIMDKNKFFQFIPPLTNSMNAYMLKKGINYKIKLFDKEENLTQELNQITKDYKYIFAYVTNADDVKIFENYPNNYFFIPTLNKSQIFYETTPNIFFGGIDYKNQISTLNQFVTDKTIIIYENRDLSKYITTLILEMLQTPKSVYKYPLNYHDKNLYNDSYVYLNTQVVNSAQILANFTYYKIETKAVLSTQLNYTPFIFSLTNAEDVKSLIIANSIFNINPIIEDNNLNLGSDINFNWLVFTTSTLLNIAYNMEVKEDIHFLNDFGLYMFFNQINYKTRLYKVFQNGFIKIEN